jgi:hypothetical protein
MFAWIASVSVRIGRRAVRPCLRVTALASRISETTRVGIEPDAVPLIDSTTAIMSVSCNGDQAVKASAVLTESAPAAVSEMVARV